MRRLRMGMIGGGPGSFIGPIHRVAAELDREIELVAGAFASSPERSREAGESYRIDPARAYPDLAAMFAAERAREDGIDFVAIVSPNHHHLPAAKAALAAGVPVISDKPATSTLAEARELAEQVRASGLPYALTHTYSGYPLVREARARVAGGALGAIRKVVVEYPQGWLAGEAVGKQADELRFVGASAFGIERGFLVERAVQDGERLDRFLVGEVDAGQAAGLGHQFGDAQVKPGAAQAKPGAAHAAALGQRRAVGRSGPSS